jgi:hypothetical protein
MAERPKDTAIPGNSAAVVDLVVSATISKLAVHWTVACVNRRTPPVLEVPRMWIYASGGSLDGLKVTFRRNRHLGQCGGYQIPE